MKTVFGWTLLAIAAFGTLLAFASIPMSPAVAAPDSVFTTAPCVDSEGASTGYFCKPLSVKGKQVAACADKKSRDVAACTRTSAANYCALRGYGRPVSYTSDNKGNLAELLCERTMTVAAAAPVEEWQPMFNVDMRGYDHREIPVANPLDWKSCKAACDADSGCKAWTLVPERRLCFLKWEDNPELLSPNTCCITAIKGMPSAGPEAKQSRVKTPAELRRLGIRAQQSAEDEVGRRTEDAVRKGIGAIIDN